MNDDKIICFYKLNKLIQLTKWLCWIIVCQIITVSLLSITFVVAIFLNSDLLLKAVCGLGICFIIEILLSILLASLKSHIEEVL